MMLKCAGNAGLSSTFYVLFSLSKKEFSTGLHVSKLLKVQK